MSENSSHKPVASDQPRPARQLTPVRRVLGVAGWTALLAASFVLANLITVGIILALGPLGLTTDTVNAAVFSLVTAVAVYMLLALGLIGIPWIGKIRTSWRDLGYGRWPGWKDIIVLPTALLAYLALTAVLAYVADIYLPGYNIEQTQEIGFAGMTHNYEYVLAFVALVILAPIIEETLFRGFLHTRIRRFAGRIGAVVIVALLFGAVHLQWNVSIDTFALGLVLGLAREYTGSIYTGIMLHMAKNGLAYYLLFINPWILPGIT